MMSLLRQTTWLALIASHSMAQELTLADIWKTRRYAAETVQQFHTLERGDRFTVLENADGYSAMVAYDVRTGKLADTLINGRMLLWKNKSLMFQQVIWNKGETMALLATETEAIYRHTSKSAWLLFNRKTGTLLPLSSEGKQQNPSFSPDGNRIAYLYKNNVYVWSAAQQSTVAVTEDGRENAIINGGVDWVYEEEFAQSTGYRWNADGSRLAWLRFDEREVPEINLTLYNGTLFPKESAYKYPKAGSANSLVSLWCWDVNSGAKTLLEKEKADQYLPKFDWTNNANEITWQRLNRRQNYLELMVQNLSDGSPARKLLSDTSNTYVEVLEDLLFLPNNQGLIFQSERSGYKHFYIQRFDKSDPKALTEGKWEVMRTCSYNAKEQILYYTSNELGITERHVWQLDMKTGQRSCLNSSPGYHDALFSSDHRFALWTWSDAKTPPVQTITNQHGKTIRVVKDNAALVEKLKALPLSQRQFTSLPGDSGVMLQTYTLKPWNFDSRQHYPVLLYVYGGPGRNLVVNQWGGNDFLWQNYMASKGYLIVCADNRGTQLRGKAFKHSTYRNLGHFEWLDQTAVARHVSNWDFVDPKRMGIQGWSFGGYLSSLCILKSPDVFKAAVAIAPVTHWKFYDSIYTERFLQTPSENEEGYNNNAPMNFAAQLKGNFLLMHGGADDNVHVQHTMELAKALQEANKPFDLMVYPNRNHGISGGNIRLHLYEKVSNWWFKNL